MPEPTADHKATTPLKNQKTDKTFPTAFRVRQLWPALLVAAIALISIPHATAVHHFIFPLLRRLPLKSFYAAATQIPSATIIGLVLASIFILQPRRRHTIIIFGLALLIASVLNETIKYTTGRARPRYSVLMGPKETAWAKDYQAQHPGTAVQTEPVDHWMGPTANHPLFWQKAGDGYASFPSGHTNCSFVLATYLSALFPEGRVLWYLAAAGCGVARVEKERHWPEDVLFGGALGWTVAKIVFSLNWPLSLSLWMTRRCRRLRPDWKKKRLAEPKPKIALPAGALPQENLASKTCTVKVN